MSKTETKNESIADNTEMLKFLGDSVRTRILTVLSIHNTTDMSISDIARLAGVDRSNIYRNNHLKQLEKLDIIKQTRKVGGSKMYQLNPKNEKAQKLVEIAKKF